MFESKSKTSPKQQSHRDFVAGLSKSGRKEFEGFKLRHKNDRKKTLQSKILNGLFGLVTLGVIFAPSSVNANEKTIKIVGCIGIHILLLSVFKKDTLLKNEYNEFKHRYGMYDTKTSLLNFNMFVQTHPDYRHYLAIQNSTKLADQVVIQKFNQKFQIEYERYVQNCEK